MKLRGQILVKLTPTELPKKNKETHSQKKFGERPARIPNNAVKNSVALNAVLRPMRSLQVPQPTAPNIIPKNMEKERVPNRIGLIYSGGRGSARTDLYSCLGRHNAAVLEVR